MIPAQLKEQKSKIILEVRDLETQYFTKNTVTTAVKGVSLELKPGEILGVVGESGSGKSTLAHSIIGLIDKNYTRISNGEILFNQMDLVKLSTKKMQNIRGKNIAMIFQNPLSALDPVYTIGNQIMEMILIHESISKVKAYERAIDLLKRVRLDSPELRINQYPHELSGGMQQRVMIAIALACNPDILIADEPTTALDVTTQASILELIRELRDEYRIAVLFITHDMGVVAELCDRMMVMREGVMVEEGDCIDVFENPQKKYTKGLLAAIPKLTEDQEWLYTVNDF